MPAILSALFSALYASMATVDTYRGSLFSIFPAMQTIDTVNGTSLGEESHMEYVIGVSA
jgi:ammonium transporter Rh